MRYVTTVAGKEYVIEIDHDDVLTVNGTTYRVDFQQLPEGGVLSLLLNNRSVEAVVNEHENHWEVLISGELYAVTVQDERAYRLAQARGQTTVAFGEVTIQSPMPGVIVKLPVQEGEAVQKGQTVVILESMKMENELQSPRAGIVHRTLATEGASVEKGQPLVVIGDPVEEEEA